MRRQTDWVQLFFSSTGRLQRTPFLIATVVLIGVLIVYDSAANPVVQAITGLPVYGALFFSAACVLSKRLHDRGRSGWWAALVLLAFFACWPSPHGFLAFLFVAILVWAAVELALMPSEQGANRFGPNPLKPPEPRVA